MGLVLLFLLALLLAAGAIFLFVRAGQRERHEDVQLRLRAMGGGEDAAALIAEPQRQVRNPLLRWICHLIWRTGVEIEAETVARSLLVLVLVVPVAVMTLGWFGGVSTVAFVLVFLWGWLSRKAAQRRAKILEQFPGFLEGTIRVLAAGNTLEESVMAAARESPDPIKPLFMSVGRQVRLGAPIEGVLMELAEIHRLRDLKVMALAASINRKYGGSLRSVLRSLIQAVRSRDSALTAETRFSALVLALIPMALMVFVFIQNPAYYQQMWADGTGRILLIGAVTLQLIGVVIIYRMMRSVEDAE
jgi:tight adherence protein B